MTKQTQTERLRARLTMVSDQCYTQEGSACPIHPVFQPQKFINLSLQACKEAGLRFVGNKGDVLFGEEIGI